MKPTSIISLIVAVMLIIAGSVACMIANSMAEADGNLLFSEKRGDEFVNTYSLSQTPVNTLDLTISNASIYIHGQSHNAYVEIINFNDNFYTLSANNQILSFKEIPDMLSMLKFWENGFSFKGLRYIFNPNQPSDEDERSIHIYLGTSDTKISDITLHSQDCDIYMDSISTGYDFDLFLNDSALTLSTVSLANDFTVVGENITFDVNDCAFHKIDIQSTSLDISMKDILVSGETKIRFASGTAAIQLSSSLAENDITLNAQNGGSVSFNGNIVGSSYRREKDGPAWSITATDGGNIILSDFVTNSGT